MTYPPAGFPPQSGPYSTPDPFQGTPFPANPNPFQQAGPPPAAPSPFGQEAWQAPVFQAGYGQAPPPPEPPRGNKRWLVITVVVAVVIAAAGTGTLLWWLNARGGESGGAATSASPSPLPTSVPPLGALRPPRDQLVPSLEKPLDKPRWTFRPESSRNNILGGDTYTVVVSVDNYGGNEGVLAVDAGNGQPRWPKPVMPASLQGRDLGSMFSKCVIDRAATTIGCAFGTGVGSAETDKGIALVFLDTATGAEKNTTKVPGTYWGHIRGMYSAGNGFVAVLDDEVVGYRADGSESWRAPYQRLDPTSAGHDNVAVYGDQGIVVILDGRTLDADTGNPILQGASSVGSAAFASGFGLSDAVMINFYDFTGKKTASIPSDGFTFIDGFGINGHHWSVGLDLQTPGSSGLYYPLAYNKTTGDLRAFDPASGRILWNRHIDQDASRGIAAYGNGTTCFIALRDESVVRVKVQTCETDSDNPFIEVPTKIDLGTYFTFLGSDGQRMLFGIDSDHNDEVVAIDGTGGQEVWRKKSDPNLAVSLWAGNGLYSTYDGVCRWL
ncbi:outer membrane assembly lipoprotein YfgL [Mycolicibacterium fortuitum]|uniref:Outer membrane assembly lipoprotein YfgL n=1 Tax=Mycolicibacterium fortuitum TaxID=1766 RepID=A0A378UZ85_MYCFO|nr:outer membrane assembly lipoprotein YfgL [Mycolicibacterium fortuitum]